MCNTRLHTLYTDCILAINMWNPLAFITDIFGEQDFGHLIQTCWGVVFHSHKLLIWDLALISQLFGLSSGRGGHYIESTVSYRTPTPHTHNNPHTHTCTHRIHLRAAVEAAVSTRVGASSLSNLAPHHSWPRGQCTQCRINCWYAHVLIGSVNIIAMLLNHAELIEKVCFGWWRILTSGETSSMGCTLYCTHTHTPTHHYMLLLVAVLVSERLGSLINSW